MSAYIENCNTQSFQESFVKDWIYLKKRLTKSDDESKEKERGIKRKAMLMAASGKSTSSDDLYDMGDIFGVGETKKPKV